MVDSVSAIPQSLQTNTQPTISTTDTTVDYDGFLQLLVAQLNNQDPTEPIDNAQLMAQLASFSSVEQQIQTNDRLDQLIQSNALGDASGLIGKQITSADGLSSGIVQAVILTADGISAELQDGSRIVVGEGSKISEAGSSPQSSGSDVASNSSDPDLNTDSALY